MASDQSNALAELAERLKLDVDELNGKHRDHLGIYQCVTDDVCKAHRIIAELAKVSTLGPKHIPGDISLYKAYAECSAIAAEEGAKDEACMW